MITLYTTHCPKCSILKKKLVDKGIEFTEVNDVEEMKIKGMMSVPFLEVDGELKDFHEAMQYLN